MKTIVFVVLMAVMGGLVYGQLVPKIVIPFDSATQKCIYKENVKVEGATAVFFYTNAKIWLMDKYLSTNLEIDQPNERISRAGEFSAISRQYALKNKSFEIPINVKFNIDLQFHEGAFQYTITNIKLTEAPVELLFSPVQKNRLGSKEAIMTAESITNSIHLEMTKLIEELKKQVNNIKN